MTRRLLPILSALAFAFAFAFAFVSMLDRSPSALPATHFSEQLEGCLGDAAAERVTSAPTAGCLRDVLVRADSLGSLPAARRALADLVLRRPSLHNSCHLAEHETGERVLDGPGEAPDLVSANLDNVCSWGFGHGVLETFGAMQPSATQWRDVLDVCRKSRGTEVYALCADGVGHAAWDATKSLPGAAARCEELLDAAAVNACAGGVLMQQFRPAERSGGSSPPLPDLRAFCDRSWPSELSRSGCAAGLGYVLAMGLIGDPVAASLGPDPSTEPSAQLQAARTGAPGLQESFGVCSSLRVDADECTLTLIQHLPRHLLRTPEALEVLCGGLPEQWRGPCTTPG